MKINHLLHFFKDRDIPSPHAFVNLPLQSTMGEFTEVKLKINELLPQFSDFISQFNNMVLTNNINVITDASGNMSLDVPGTMSDTDAETIGNKHY